MNWRHSAIRETFLTVDQFSLVPELLAKSDLISVVPAATALNSPYGDQLAIIDTPFQFQPRTINLIWHERADTLLSHRWMREEIVAAVKSRGGATTSPAPGQDCYHAG